MNDWHFYSSKKEGISFQINKIEKWKTLLREINITKIEDEKNNHKGTFAA